MDLTKHLTELALYMREQGIGADVIPKVKLRADDQVANQPLGPTAYFEPSTNQIVLYVKGRHTKDILRSFAHEMIHADQHAKGQLDGKLEGAGDPNYAQNDGHLRKMEEDAYLRGNMMFRDWTDHRARKLRGEAKLAKLHKRRPDLNR